MTETGGPPNTETARFTSKLRHPTLLCRRRLRDGRLALFCITRKSKPAYHHLFPRLIAPAYFLARVRIEFVLCGVVKMRHTIQPSPLWKSDRFFRNVSQLPVEIVFWHVEQ